MAADTAHSCRTGLTSVAEIVALGVKHRGPHDELPRAFSAGQSFRFDILMDIGGFRDMHRHRRCVQLIQPYTDLHGYETPVCPGQPTLAEAGLAQTYTAAMDAAHAAYRALRDAAGPEAAAYLLPLGTRVRAVFKMDFAEALYIAEAQRCCGALQLSARGLGDVLRRGQAASGAGRLFPD